MIARPFYPRTSHDAVALLSRDAVRQLHAIADSTSEAAQERASDPTMAMIAVYAGGVADVLAWLNGAEPSTALSELLDG